MTRKKQPVGLDRVAAASLVEDFALYPRHDVNETHVNELVRAIRGGSVLPALIVDRATKRIVDGFHRRRAFIKAEGDEVEVDVDFRDYADDAALFLEAVQLNSGHGRRLDRQDQTRIVLKLEELQVEPRVIAMALHVPEQEVKTLALRIVRDDSGQAFPQKRGLEHLRGQRLSDSQLSAMRSVRSAEVGRICAELSRLLEQELVDYEDPKLEAQLSHLQGLIATTLVRLQERQPVDVAG